MNTEATFGEADAQNHTHKLRAMLASPSTPTDLWQASRRAMLALEFRAADPMVGLPEASKATLTALEEAIDEALSHLVHVGHADAYGAFVTRMTQRDAPGAFRALTQRADVGDVSATFHVAWMTFHLQRHAWAPRAHALLHQALDQDVDGRLAHLLGWYTLRGFGCDPDPAYSFSLQRRAAALEHPGALFEVATMLAQGICCDPDPHQAANNYQRAAELGSSRAMYNLGAFYATGRPDMNIACNIAEAVRWYDLAAREGHGRAAYILGIMYAQGTDIDPDPAKASHYLQLADAADFPWRQLAEAAGVDVTCYGFGKTNPGLADRLGRTHRIT